jgi:hypothetical protein
MKEEKRKEKKRFNLCGGERKRAVLCAVKIVRHFVFLRERVVVSSCFALCSVLVVRVVSSTNISCLGAAVKSRNKSRCSVEFTCSIEFVSRVVSESSASQSFRSSSDAAKWKKAQKQAKTSTTQMSAR